MPTHTKHNTKEISPPRPPNVPQLRALWSLLDGIWGLLKGSWGVLAIGTTTSEPMKGTTDGTALRLTVWEAQDLSFEASSQLANCGADVICTAYVYLCTIIYIYLCMYTDREGTNVESIWTLWDMSQEHVLTNFHVHTHTHIYIHRVHIYIYTTSKFVRTYISIEIYTYT